VRQSLFSGGARPLAGPTKVNKIGRIVKVRPKTGKSLQLRWQKVMVWELRKLCDQIDAAADEIG